MKLEKVFYSPFNVYHFSEDDYDREALQKDHNQIKQEVQKLFAGLKNVLDNTEQTMNKIFSETDPKKSKDLLKTFKEEYQQLVNKFAQLEIETNKL
jgi:molecular chaperone GrpE (heat shock protein)